MPLISKKVEQCHGVDYALFNNEILKADRPVLLKGLVKDWPLTTAAAESNKVLSDYLKTFNVDEQVRILIGNPNIGGRFFYNDDMSGFNFQQKSGSFSMAMALLESYRGRASEPALYIGATSIAKVLPGLEVDNALPIFSKLVQPNIWIGNPVTIATHFDTSSNVACAVAGRRRFTVFPPEQTKNLYVGPLDFNPAGAPVSMVDLKNPDFERYPRFKEALNHAQVADLEPGDALYMPPLWWHNVESFDDFNILVNYWWDNVSDTLSSPIDSLIHAIVSVGHLPSNERKAWRYFFEHFVFNENNPVAHLAPKDRRMLGELSPELTAEIRSYLHHKTKPKH